MKNHSYQKKIKSLLAKTDIELNGDRPWDIQITNENTYSEIVLRGSIGLGQTYMRGWWDCKQLDEFFYRLLRCQLHKTIKPLSWYYEALKAKLFNPQKISRAFQIGEKHYDIGNHLYQNMLDKRMIYSCGYWETASTLDEAQEAKLDLICQKLKLKPGMSLLDIGCGWGGTAKFIAERYDINIVGVTVSKQQAKYAKEICHGLPIDIRLQDYRDIKETFDRVISIGMFEHVGVKNYETYMQTVHRCLKDDGLFLLHTIGCNESAAVGDPWIARYIFPNSKIPSVKQVSTAFEGLFVLEDWHSFGCDYDRTLLCWYRNFKSNWGKLTQNYDTQFYRMWKYICFLAPVHFEREKTNFGNWSFPPMAS